MTTINKLFSEWQEAKANYALPDSTVDIGNIYHFACAFEEKLADTMRELEALQSSKHDKENDERRKFAAEWIK